MNRRALLTLLAVTAVAVVGVILVTRSTDAPASQTGNPSITELGGSSTAGGKHENSRVGPDGSQPSIPSVASSEKATPVPQPTVDPKELHELTELAKRFSKEYEESLVRVNAELDGSGNMKDALLHKIHYTEELVKPLALIQAMQDPGLKGHFAAMIGRRNTRFYLQVAPFEPIVAKVKLDPAILDYRTTPERFEQLLASSEAKLEAEYVDLTSKLRLPGNLEADTQHMYSSRFLLHAVTVDLGGRGYQWRPDLKSFTPKTR